MNKLIFIPFPSPDESPVSIIRRTARKHGYKSLRSFIFRYFSDKAFGKTEICKKNSKTAQALAREAIPYSADLLENFYEESVPPRKNFLKIGALNIPTHHLRGTSVAFCDKCFEGDTEYMVAEFKLALCCPYHQRRYLLSCPHCKHPISWLSPLDGTCIKCKQPLTCESCPIENCTLEQHLVSILRHGNQKLFDSLRMLCKDLGFHPELSLLPASCTQDVLKAASLILSGNVTKITSFLHELSENNPSTAPRWIAARLGLISIPEVQQAIDQFLLNFPDTTTTHNLRAPPFYLTRRQIQHALNTSSTLMTRCRKLSLLPGVTAYEKFLTADEANKISNHLNQRRAILLGELPENPKNLLSFRQVQSKLAIGKDALRALIKSGVLHSYGFKRNSYFKVEHINHFASKYETARHIKSRGDCSTSRLRRAQDALHINPAYNGSLLVSNWIFEVKDSERILNYLAKYAGKNLPQPPITKSKKITPKTVETDLGPVARNSLMTVRDAACEYGTDAKYLRLAVHEGLIQEVPQIQKTETLISKTEILHFHESYLTASDLEKKGILSKRCVQDLLSCLHIHPCRYLKVKKDTIIPLYNSTQIDQLLKKLAAPPITEYYFLATHRAAKLTGLGRNSLLKISEHGYISRLVGARGSYYTSSKLIDFKQKYICSPEILNSHGFPTANTPRLVQILSLFGLTPDSYFKNPTLAIYDRVDFNSRSPANLKNYLMKRHRKGGSQTMQQRE